MNNFYIFSLAYPETLDKETFISLVSDFDIEGLEEKSDSVEVYISLSEKEQYEIFLKDLSETIQLEYTIGELENKNWNAEWESNFEPVLINDKIGIRAIFHEPLQNVDREIIIQPQMSFGTGHHATTAQVMMGMQQLGFSNKKVLDLGSGTAVLAIYAEILGASEIDALDNDEWCFNNAKENIVLNQCNLIKPLLGSIEVVMTNTYDIILANIHKNFHLEHLTQYALMMKNGAYILLSGFYASDSKEILDKALECNLIANYSSVRDNWAMIILYKN